MTDTSPYPSLPRSVGLVGAIGVMAGIMIGSGIFRTPASIAQVSQNPPFILAMWAFGGVISLFGALTYAELATLYPESGGIYVFLREGFGRCVAFVFGWTYMLLSKPLAAAGIAMVLAEHLGPLIQVDMSHAWAPFGVTTGQITVCAMLILLTWLNTRGVALGANVATGITALKVAALAAIILLALALRRGDAANFVPGPESRPWFAALAPIMAAVMWTYDGWSDVGAIAGEVRNPGRTLPLAYVIGTLLVAALYIGVNAVYIWLVPLDTARATQTVAPLAMQRLVGPLGGTIVTAVIVVATFGATHGSIITGARVTYAQARDGLLFRWLAGVHPVYRTPARALWIQCLLSCAAVLLLKTFENLAGGFIFTIWIFYGLAGAAIFVLRRTQRDRPRSFRCPGYPIVPGLFVLVALVMTVLSIVDDWVTTSRWLGGLTLGVPVYLAWESVRRRAAP